MNNDSISEVRKMNACKKPLPIWGESINSLGYTVGLGKCSEKCAKTTVSVLLFLKDKLKCDFEHARTQAYIPIF